MKMSYDLTLKGQVRGGRLAAKEMKGEREGEVQVLYSCWGKVSEKSDMWVRRRKKKLV